MSRGYQVYTAVGGIGRDPEVKSTPNGTKVATTSLAVEEGYGEKIRTEWVNLVFWGALAETAEKILKKGRQVAITGKLKTSSWPDKTTGKTVYRTEINVSDVQLMESSKPAEGQTRTAAPQTRAATPPPAPRAVASEDPFAPDDDIPF